MRPVLPGVTPVLPGVTPVDRRTLEEAVAPWSALVADLPPGTVVGCSGGADSLALLALAAAAGRRPVAVYVDHELRGAGATEFSMVARLASTWGAEAARVRAPVSPGAGLEERARVRRHAALEHVRATRGAGAVALAHTADDQAETVLLQLLRGGALAAVAGIPPRRERVVRPLLGVRRSVTLEICRRLGAAPVRDPMNEDLSFTRVWVRREVLPMLAAGVDRDVVELLARQAALARDEHELLDELADELLGRARVEDAVPSELDCRVLREAPAPLSRRAVRRWLGPPPPSSAEVARVLAVVAGDHVATELRGRGRVARHRGRLRREPLRVAGEPVPVVIPGRTHAPGWRIDTWMERAAPVRWPDGRGVAVFDADRVDELVVSSVEHGGRVPAQLCDARSGEALWSLGYRVSGHARVTPSTRRFLWIAVDGDASA